MDVLDSFLTGSYARSTMIAPLSEADIDIFIVLDPKDYESDGQAVTITFTDFVVDVVPAFNRKGGGYLIPNSVQKTWIATNPKTHVDIMVQKNKNHNEDLVPVVKMSRLQKPFHIHLLRKAGQSGFLPTGKQATSKL